MSEDLEDLSNVEEQDEEFPEVKEDIKVWKRSTHCMQHKTKIFQGPLGILDFKIKRKTNSYFIQFYFFILCILFVHRLQLEQANMGVRCLIIRSFHNHLTTNSHRCQIAP